MVGTEGAIEAIEVMGRAHALMRLERDEAERLVEAVCTSIVTEVVRDNEDLFIDLDEPDFLDDELIEDSKDYLIDSERYRGQLPDRLRMLLDENRSEAVSRFDRAAVGVEHTTRDVRRAKLAVDAVLRDWVGARSAKEWPYLLTAWRASLSLTTREAAEALGVSASAITRYESAARSPSVPQLTAMVENMTNWDPVGELTDAHRAARRFYRILGKDPDTAIELIEEADSARLRLEAQLEEVIERRALSDRQLSALVALATDPSTLDQLAVLARSDALASIRDLPGQSESAVWKGLL